MISGNKITTNSYSEKFTIRVKPEIEVASDKALETAEIMMSDTLMSKTKNAQELFSLNWDHELLKAINNPITLDSLTLKSYAGTYGERVLLLKTGSCITKEPAGTGLNWKRCRQPE